MTNNDKPQLFLIDGNSLVYRVFFALAEERSPYLLQHKDNPVDWYPWGEEAFVRARAEDKPVLVSIGYSSCHWCHMMERCFRTQLLRKRVASRDREAVSSQREY